MSVLQLGAIGAAAIVFTFVYGVVWVLGNMFYVDR